MYVKVIKELKEELTEYKFETESDTEVVLHGYEKWGHDLPKKLRGMFAYAIYDKNKGEIFISAILIVFQVWLELKMPDYMSNITQ
jgi:glucosamine 6-phosphate synthetase-like amidotransferase/phosphosugar isomerase protein